VATTDGKLQKTDGAGAGEAAAAAAGEMGQLHLSHLLEELVSSQVSVVVHNGLMDLMFLFHNFFGSLPPSLPTFTGKVAELFKHLYDTKHIASQQDEQATFLEYLYHKCERNSAESSLRSDRPISCTIVVPMCVTRSRAPPAERALPCQNYKSRGNCDAGLDCQFSHNIDVILDDEERKLRKKRSSKKAPPPATNTTEKETRKRKAPEVSEQDSQPATNLDEDGVTIGKKHSAGFDSFATGYIYAHLLSKMEPVQMHAMVNQVYIYGKEMPLRLYKSRFGRR